MEIAINIKDQTAYQSYLVVYHKLVKIDYLIRYPSQQSFKAINLCVSRKNIRIFELELLIWCIVEIVLPSLFNFLDLIIINYT